MRTLGRLLTAIAWLGVLAFGAALALVIVTPDPGTSRPGPVATVIRLAETALATSPPRADCAAPGFEAPAQANGQSLMTLAWAPFHRPETGWAIYVPRIGWEIGSTCPPDTPAFAKALAHWQGERRLKATGVLDPASFAVMNNSWELARPFVRLSQTGVCPDPPPASNLTAAAPDEGYAGKPIQLRPGALTAYRQMVADARAASPAIAADHRLLSILSGYRSPEDDTARCARDNDCQNITRAACSAHRTGLAVDLYLGAAPGSAPGLSDDASRLYQARTPAYAWLVANAARYGFINYPFEPWHWEWTGEPQ